MQADKKLKMTMKHGSDAECSDLYHQQTRFRCSPCIRPPESAKIGAHALSAHTFIISEHDSDVRICNNSLLYG